MIKKGLLLIGLIGISFFLYQQNKVALYSKNLFYLNTYINVKIYGNDKVKINKAFAEIDNIYKTYHQLTSRYDAYPDIINIYYINHILKDNEKVKIDRRLYDLLKYSKDAYDISQGLFNIAIGNLVDLWQKYRDLEEGVPTCEELAMLESLTIKDIMLEDDYIFWKRKGVMIDLGGISKGYTTELVGNYLEEIGLNNYIINAGGNVKVGQHYNNEKYKIGLEEPKTGSTNIYKIIKATSVSIVTSGDYNQFYEYNGVIYHHLLDPKTLYPPHYFKAVTIITKDSKLADMLATTLFLMPFKEGEAYIEKLDGVEAIWYVSSNEIYYSKGIGQYE